MKLTDDGDIIKALGYVALYAAYVEEAIDECVYIVASHDPVPPSKLDRFPTGQKIEYIKASILGKSMPQELAAFPGLLEYLEQLFINRNEVVHGRIYGGLGGQADTLWPNRRNNPERKITSLELYELAEYFSSTLQSLNQASMFSLPRFFNQ